MDLINELLHCLNGIDYNIFDEAYIDMLLDSRYSAPFDTEWCRAYEEINAFKNSQAYTDDMQEEQDNLREKVFSMIEEYAESELAAYVSDDFGLIYDSLVLNYHDEWINKLIAAYKDKKIPAGKL